ncbi:MAG: glycosyltransferase family 39 protein [Planctomycetota bacterium]
MEGRRDRRLHWFAATLGLLALWLLLYLPYAGAPEWHHEEARRAVPAREMLTSGDWVEPTLFGQSYWNKPPLFMWSVAAASRFTGGVDEWAVRWPCLLGSLLGACIALAFAGRYFGVMAGVWAGILYLVTWTVVDKGREGEIEGLFGPLVLGALCALWAAPRSLAAALLSGLFLGAALLAKGPPALLFLGAGYAALWYLSERGLWRNWRVYVPAVVGILPLLLWTYLLMQRVEGGALWNRWGGELAREGDGGWSAYWRDRGTYGLGMLLGLFPTSWLLLGGLGEWRRDPAPRALQYALLAGLLALLLFALPVGTRARYGFPAYGLFAIAGGGLLARVRARNQRFRSPITWRPVAWLCALVGIAGGVLAAAAPWWDPLHVGDPTIPARLAGALGLGAGTFALYRSTSALRRDFLPAALLALVCGRMVYHLLVIRAQAADRPFETMARVVENLRHEDQTIWTGLRGQYNAAAYLSPPPRWWQDGAAPVQPGDLLLLLPDAPLPAEQQFAWQKMVLPAEQMDRWAVYRRVGE